MNYGTALFLVEPTCLQELMNFFLYKACGFGIFKSLGSREETGFHSCTQSKLIVKILTSKFS